MVALRLRHQRLQFLAHQLEVRRGNTGLAKHHRHALPKLLKRLAKLRSALLRESLARRELLSVLITLRIQRTDRSQAALQRLVGFTF